MPDYFPPLFGLDAQLASRGLVLASNFQTGTSYTLQASDNGLTVDLSNASGITLTLPATLPANFSCSIVQGGAGQVTIATAPGALVRQPDSYTKTRKQWSQIGLYIRTNAGGSAAEYVLGGDMA